ncbi:MAG: hypothetical protein CVU06_15315 [Bacteroidetes bacterium HGW-Bacteroidetes-22]|nr:MAG: hypothetical protein CVU06_15315 [Bacteroidetes bacterium HGW-Bacteroidetes-22]
MYDFITDIHSNSTAVRYKRNQLKKKIVYRMNSSGPQTIPLLSRELKISMPSVDRLIKELIADAFVEDMGEGPSEGGRKPHQYKIKPSSYYSLCLDISISEVKMALIDFNNGIHHPIKTHFKRLEDNQEYVEWLVSIIELFIIESAVSFSKISGISIALPGLIDPDKKVSRSYFTQLEPNLWDYLQIKLNKEVLIDNDARLMTRGEHVFGLAAGKNDVLCINVGAGLGMGMILNGQLYRGNTGSAAEFGHIKSTNSSLPCYCGQEGCLETIISGPAMEKNAMAELSKEDISAIRKITEADDKSFYEGILDFAKQGNASCKKIIQDTGHELGLGISTLIILLNPEMIIIGGCFAGTGDLIINPIKQAMLSIPVQKFAEGTEIVTSQLGHQAVLLGAHVSLIQHLFKDVM